uniref:Uncharacterized protein n=1 Tax=Arundo donax TaxID=35708 RepID=A0A0A9F9D7_ARUDO
MEILQDLTQVLVASFTTYFHSS